MAQIHVLDEVTIDKIAAGEVVERPSSVVKELVENAIDAGTDSITVEMKDGGISFIRITDNGSGIPASEISTAFLRHATSKIENAGDLDSIQSLGFRGEALSSICAVAQVELITKTADSLTGTHYIIEGGKQKVKEEVGAPNGSTFIIRNLFFNTPVRRKFLKQPATEGSYIADLMEHLALSHPHISFKFIAGSQTKFYTSGNGDLKEVIYRIYGKDIIQNLLPISYENNGMRLEGFVGNPSLVRSNRNQEIFFINGRYIRSQMLSRAVEEGCKEYLMQHKFPFCVMHMNLEDFSEVDVNVHPTKMEVRFSNPDQVYDQVSNAIKDSLNRKEMIPKVELNRPSESTKAKNSTFLPNIEVTPVILPEIIVKPRNNAEKPSIPEPFETKRMQEYKVMEETKYEILKDNLAKYEQEELFENKILTPENKIHYQFIGQVFDTYWLIQFEDKLLIVDQHAAHEKVKYERLIKRYHEKEILTQNLMPPIIVTLTGQEEVVFKEYESTFNELGFEVDAFGGNEYAIRTVPVDLYGCNEKEMFLEVLDELADGTLHHQLKVVEEKIASMACKAAVKGNHSLSSMEAKALIDELMTLDNPYNCPHGRPTIISMSQSEMEKKFKRQV